MTGNKVCPVPHCRKEFKGQGWEGIDAHWRSQRVGHEDIESYEDAKKADLLLGQWRPPEERNELKARP